MKKALIIFTPVFFALFVLNQSFYGWCFKGYCLAAAFPKVLILSAILTGVFYAISKSENTNSK